MPSEPTAPTDHRPGRRRLLQALAASPLVVSPLVRGQVNPAESASAKLVFGIPPGAAGTTLASGVIAEMGRHWAPPIRLEHVLGREARRSAEMVKAAVPNGLTLLHCQSALVSLFPLTYQRLSYAPQQDFTPLGGLASYTFVLTVGPMVPREVRTLDDYLRWVAETPAGRQYGVILRGSQGHLAGLQLARARDSGMQPNIYGGTAPMVRDMLTGVLPAAFMIYGNRKDLFADGTLRALAVTSRTRWPDIPDVPALAELGVDGLHMEGWYGWFGPANMPVEVHAPLAAALQTSMQTPAYGELLAKLSFQPLRLNPAQTRERLLAELAANASAMAVSRLTPAGG